MADSGIQKVRILQQDIPTVDYTTPIYIRYRIVSEDQNRRSHWSPVTFVDQFGIPTYVSDLEGGEEDWSS